MPVAERNRTEKEVIFKPRKKSLGSLDELMDACLPTLTARLWATCRWPRTMDEGWKIGDYNFLVTSVRPDEQSSLYVQFWSEPHEPVSAEVCSGEWSPGAVKYVRQRQRQLVEGLGYKVGGRAHNFQKEVRIETSAQAETVAREVLTIYYEVFGYRGQWPLELEWHQGERADHDPVYSSVTPEDFLKLALHFGFHGQVNDDAAGDGDDRPGPLVVLRRGKKPFVAALSARVPDNNLYSVVVLHALVPPPPLVDDAAVGRNNPTLRFARLVRNGPGELDLSMPLRFDGGVTARWITSAFEHWLLSWRLCERMLKGARGAASPAKRGRRSEPAVH